MSLDTLIDELRGRVQSRPPLSKKYKTARRCSYFTALGEPCSLGVKSGYDMCRNHLRANTFWPRQDEPYFKQCPETLANDEAALWNKTAVEGRIRATETSKEPDISVVFRTRQWHWPRQGEPYLWHSGK